MALDVERLRRVARQVVIRVDDWEDIAQEAVAIALERGGADSSSTRQLLSDAMRSIWGRVGSAKRAALALTLSLHYPLPWVTTIEYEPDPAIDDLASLYPSDEALLQRWNDELDEDHAEEWRRLPAATRDQRRIEAMAGLGTSY